MTREQIEYLHSIGKMPDRYYYAQNGKSAEYNLWEHHQKIYEKYKKRQKEKQQQELEQKKHEEAFEKAIDKDVHKQLDKIFSNI